jgi:hypothetical protein
VGLNNFEDGMGMKPKDTNLVQNHCGIMFNEMHRHQRALVEFYYYMSEVFEREIIVKSFKRLVEWSTPDVAACIPENVDEYTKKKSKKDIADSTKKNNKPSGDNSNVPKPKIRRLQAPVTPAAKPVTPAAKPVTPAAKPVTPAAKPVTPAAKPDNDHFSDDLLPQGSGLGRDPFKSYQKVVIDSWEAWQYSENTNQIPTTIIPSKKCWNTPAMRALVKELIYGGDVTSLQRLIAPLMAAMKFAFKYAGDAKAWDAWIDFRGRKFVFRAIFPNRGSWFSGFNPKTYSDEPATPAAAAVTPIPKKRQLKNSNRTIRRAASTEGP